MRGRAYVVSGLKAAAPARFLRLLVGQGAAIRSYTSPVELILLYDEATRCAQQGRIVEIGSHLGASSVVLAESLRRVEGRQPLAGAQVYCIDTWRNDAMSEGTLDTFAEFTANTAGWSRYIIPLRGYSTEVRLPFEDTCDLVFIDGDHSYEGVKADTVKYAPRVRVGGRLVFHDQDRSGVTLAIGELLVTGHWRVSCAAERMLSLERIS